MNEKGVSLFKLIAVVLGIGAFFTFIFPGVNTLLNGTTGVFRSYESTMEDAAVEAVKNCVGSGSFGCVNPSKGETKDIYLSYLIKKGYIDEIATKNGSTCDAEKSFVRVIGKGNLKFDYKVCLYCGRSYTTDDEMCK